MLDYFLSFSFLQTCCLAFFLSLLMLLLCWANCPLKRSLLLNYKLVSLRYSVFFSLQLSFVLIRANITHMMRFHCCATQLQRPWCQTNFESFRCYRSSYIALETWQRLTLRQCNMEGVHE